MDSVEANVNADTLLAKIELKHEFGRLLFRISTIAILIHTYL